MAKIACFTDIHFGAKNNSEQHNKECFEFVKWFISQSSQCDAIVFLGDWHENRSAIHIGTLDYSSAAAEELNKMGKPVFFCVGNHDLLNRNTREVYSTRHFQNLEHFNIVSHPEIVKIPNSNSDMLVTPFLFSDEYETELPKYLTIPIWFGHFEFKDFVVTGSTVKMQHGPDHNSYKNVKRIFSGHFHKRQTIGNVTYIGNTFPTSFADTNDTDRGMMIYDTEADTCQFINWDNAPRYIRVKASDIISGNVKIDNKCCIKCIDDTQLTYEDALKLKQQVASLGARQIDISEDQDVIDEVGDAALITEDQTGSSVDETILKLLATIEHPSIQTDRLVSIYQTL